MEVVTGEILGKIATTKKQFKEISRLSDFCLIDIRVLFIVVSVYSSVSNISASVPNVVHFGKASATDDVNKAIMMLYSTNFSIQYFPLAISCQQTTMSV